MLLKETREVGGGLRGNVGLSANVKKYFSLFFSKHKCGKKFDTQWDHKNSRLANKDVQFYLV